jgi:predicted permease
VRTHAPFLRSLLRSPAISIAVATTFALGIGVSTALFAYLAFYLFPTFEAPEPERIAQVEIGTEQDPAGRASDREFAALAGSGAFERLAGTLPIGATATFERQSQHAWGRATGPDLFRLFAARAAHGRLLADDDERADAAPVVVLGHRLWRRLFASDPGAVGRAIHLNGQAHTVVGVVERGFQGLGFASEFFVPIAQAHRLSGFQRDPAGEDKWMTVWAQLPAGDGALARARDRAATALAALDAEQPLPEGARRAAKIALATEPGDWIRTDPYYAGARYLTGAAALFLLLAAGNVSGLLLARATARDREWAVRKALGASPARLAAAIAGEVAPAVLVGLAGALAVARLLMRWIESVLITPVGGIGASWAVEEARVFPFRGLLFAFAAGATAVALAVAVGAPLARVLRRPPNRALRAESSRSGADRTRLGARRLMVAGQLALAVVLVVGGALLARTLRSLANASPGFDAGGLVMATVHLPRSAGGPGADVATYLGLLERARSVSGVRGVTLAHMGPNSGWSRATQASPVEAPGNRLDVSYNFVGPRYHSTLGVPLLHGRELDERDRPDALPAVVVSRALASKLFGAENVVGRRLRIDEPMRTGDLGPEMEIVGVAADAGVTSAAEPERPWVFFAYGQKRHSRMAIVLRTNEPLALLEPKLHDLVAATRSDASLIDLVSSEEQLDRALHAQRLNAAIAGGLALAGVATALGGLAALQLFAVNLRRRELGIRAALGASRHALVGAVLRDSLRLAAVGALVGLAAAAGVARLIESLLYGVRPLDPATFVAVPLAFAAAVVAASLPPALRAARVDPTESLRAL